MRDARRAAWLLGGAALILFALSLALYWPGFASYDSVVQYGEVLSGQYDDWHPPAMARLWALLGGARFGTAPMFLLQIALYWLGLGLIASRLALQGRTGAGIAALLCGLLPPALAWQVVVLKDAQGTGAMLAAAGIAGWWRLSGRPIPRLAWAAIAPLLVYAALVRLNGAIAALSFTILLTGWPRARLPQAFVIGVGTALLLLAMPLINHRLLGAEDSGVARIAPLYDLAAIAAANPQDRVGGIAPAAAVQLRTHGCITPVAWDPLGEPPCDALLPAAWQAMPAPRLYMRLADAALHHPLSYAAHRLAHLNSTERWLVRAVSPLTSAIEKTEPNHLGLVTPAPPAGQLQHGARLLARTPFGWPICYTLIAAIAFLSALRGTEPRRQMAAALAGSALALEASFALLSVASDLRYHLWPMLAACLALVLLPERPHRALLIGLLLVAGAGLIARVALPM